MRKTGGAVSTPMLARGIIAWVLCTAPVVAAAQTKYDHWAIIERSMRELDGLSRVNTATPQQTRTLIDNLMQRGQVYLDLYELQRIVVRDHARMLDSAAKAGSTSYAAAPFFLGRALQDAGDVAGATAAYRRAATTAPVALRPLANEWMATLSGSGNQWQQGIIAWRAGKPVSRAVCPATSPQCALFQALIANDVVAMARLQREMSNRPKADFVETVASKTGPVSLEYFDPLTLQLLSAADFAIVAAISDGKKEYAATRGIALLRCGKFKDAENVLKPIFASGGAAAAELAPLLGEAMYRQQNKSGAEQVWRAASGAGLNVLSDVKSSLGLDSAGTAKQFANESSQDLDRNDDGPRAGLYLARALLRFNMLPQAEGLLSAIRPATKGTSARTVLPDVLAVLAQSEYRTGRLPNSRDRYALARADLQGIAELSPLVAKLLDQLQLVTMLMEGEGIQRGH